MTKVLRRGLSSSSTSSSLIAAMCRRVPLEGGAPLLGSSPAAHAAGVSRLMHSGQWRNSMLSGGNVSKLAEQKVLLFRTRGALSKEHKIQSGQFGSKRFIAGVPFGSDPHDYINSVIVGIFALVTFGVPFLRERSK